MSTPVPPKPAFTWQEAFSDMPELMSLGDEALRTFQPVPTTGAGWAAGLGLGPGSLGYVALATYDTVKAGPVTLQMALSVIGVTPDGLLGRAVAFGQKIAAQAKD